MVLLYFLSLTWQPKPQPLFKLHINFFALLQSVGFCRYLHKQIYVKCITVPVEIFKTIFYLT